MSFLFKRVPKSPQELVRVLEELLVKLDSAADPKRALEDVHRYLPLVKTLLSGEDGSGGGVVADQAAQVAQEICNSNCLYYMVLGLRRMDFDLRKDVVLVYGALLKRLNGTERLIVQCLLLKSDTLVLLMCGPEHEELAASCGKILRECIVYEQLHYFVLHHSLFWNYFEYTRRQQFETIAETLQTLEALLTTNKKLVGEFLATNKEYFVAKINALIQSENYVLKRRSARLLNDILQQKHCQTFLLHYTDDPTSLKLVMLLLSDKLKNVNMEGFQILKFFIAKPKKTQKIFDIFVKNKENFLRFFDGFDISDEEASLCEERDYVVDEIRKLPNLERLDAPSSTSAS